MFKSPKLARSFVECGEDLILENKEFDAETFLNLNIPKKDSGRSILKNVAFNKCKSDFPTTIVGKSIHIIDVTLYNLSGSLFINPDVHLENLKVKGSKPTTLEIYFLSSLNNETMMKHYADKERHPKGFIALDISEYTGQIQIHDIPVRMIKINPERHIKVYSNLGLSRDDINDMGFKGHYLKWDLISCLSGEYERVSCLPPKRHKEYDNTLHDFEVLRKYYRQQGIEE